MKDSLSILSYISRTSPSILTSVHNAMDKIYKSLIAHGYKVCDWDSDKINDEVASLLGYTLYDSETCKYAIMTETSLIAIANNISDAVFEFCRERKYENIIGFESYDMFVLYFEKSAMRDPEYKSLSNSYKLMKHDLMRHGFNKREIFKMMQDIVQEHFVVCNQYELFSKIKSGAASGHPTIEIDPNKKTNRIIIHDTKNKVGENDTTSVKLYDATDYDENDPEFDKFPDWLKEELKEIQDLQDSSDEDDDDDDDADLTHEELIDRLMKIIQENVMSDEDDDDEEDDDKPTQEELIDHAMACLMDQVDDYKNAILPLSLFLLLKREMKARLIFEYPALASVLFGFPF